MIIFDLMQTNQVLIWIVLVSGMLISFILMDTFKYRVFRFDIRFMRNRIKCEHYFNEEDDTILDPECAYCETKLSEIK